MVREVKEIYAVVSGDSILAFDTTLKPCIAKFNAVEPKSRNYFHYRREMKTDRYEFFIEERKYVLQRLPA